MAIFCVETTDKKLRFGRFLHLFGRFFNPCHPLHSAAL